MEVLALAGGAFVVLAAGFLAEPLFRSEDELEPINRPRPGVRTLYGPTEEDESEVEYGPLLDDDRVRCLHCGSVVDSSYRYCGECLEPLGTRASA
ncbi:hypothetical protein GRX03_02430 [Halovenus sp. WSH3]|uniref:DUF7577 domain-containing protein n=1 Tax=Halovenus carboxidivorans TaxID=2692199 RepID=A0A6B0T4L8_9EURY|nr:hypothetical protein [Halovenus carboxidivorans]MXR50463.1 hypothetical protein [Halovenus carboxidivorans]